jgi:dipeptide/tripeptide permease
MDESTSTAMFHFYELLTFLFPIVGAICADSYFGLYKAIIAQGSIALYGSVIVSLATFGGLSIFIQ